jgi:hypothetical protein
MLNPFFLQGSRGEQNLLQDLMNEQLKIYGVEVYYIPRQYVTEKSVIKEVIQSDFTKAFPIEAYVDSYEGYGGQQTIMSKFGIQDIDDLTLIISRERFEEYIVPLTQNIANKKLTTRPKEGDIIYFPLGDRTFEIKYVEHEKPFYQLQKNYVYELRCELFRYEDEVIKTGIDFIDDNTENQGHIQTLNMIGYGSTATAISSIAYGGVKSITIVNRGSGYTSTPNLLFSKSPSAGGTATGIATMIGGIVDLCSPDKSLLRVQGIKLINPGYGYTVAPNIEFIGGGGSGAIATTLIGNGIVGIITVTNGGSGYTSQPNITFSGSYSSVAIATANIVNGSIDRIYLLNAGSGYSQIPTVTISAPQNIVGFGTYQFNEVVVGSSSSATGRVKTWDSITNILQIFSISGEFSSGETLVGQESGANYKLSKVNADNIIANSNNQTNKTDIYSDNLNIQNEANAILDFSESNPFGIP